ncbi:MAG: LuxR C-terminal-related transcriptional regulator, partial [Cellulomonadaceae bacterium]
RDKGLEMPDDALIETTESPSTQSSPAQSQPLYQLSPSLHEVLQQTPSPFDAQHRRQIHRDFARALVREKRDPDVWLALRHARLAEDWETLHMLWVRHALGLLNRSMETTIWAFGSLPSEALRTYPFLKFAATFFDPTLIAHDGEDRRATLRAVFATLPAAARALSTTRNGTITLHLLTGLMLQQRSDGALTRAQHASRRLGAELDRQTRNGGVDDSGLEAWCLLQMGTTSLIAGRLEEARMLTLDAYGAGLAGGIDSAQNVVNAAAQLATIYALEGSTTEAQQWVEISDGHQCASWFDKLMRLPARIAEAMVSLDRLECIDGSLGGEREAGWRGVEMWPFIARITARREVLRGAAPRALLDLDRSRANHPVPRGGSQPLEIELLLAGPQADALVAVGQAGRARAALERIAARSAQTPDHIAGIAVPYARAILHCGETAASRRVAFAIAHGSGVHPTADRLEATFLLVEILAAEEGNAQAREKFRVARQAADELQLWRLYATLPPALLAELTADDGDPLPEHVRFWLQRHGPVFPPVPERPRLTRREAIVLERLVTEPSLAQIAAELTVSVNTVKSQRSSLYRKLGARSREEALAAAARLGLLDDQPPVE